MNKTLNIFKAGTHTSAGGQTLGFSESDLEQSANAYDVSLHEAPIVVGHPKDNLPAYGWIQSLSFGENGLEAEPHQVDEDFSELVNAGRFKKISASFYTPDSPSNPVPGVYYLRHVGFLGAQPPAVKGLRDASFSEDDNEFVEFQEPWGEHAIARIFRSLREWMIGKEGIEAADKVIPDYQVRDLEDIASRAFDKQADPEPGFAEPKPKPSNGDSTMNEEELKAAQAKLEADQKAIDDKMASFAEKEAAMAKREQEITNQANADFVEGLIKQGKIAPGHKDAIVGVLGALSTEATVSFKEDDGEKTVAAADALKKVLSEQKPVVDFGEHSKDDNTELDGDMTEIELSQKAVAYQESMKAKGIEISIADAVGAVVAGKAE